MWGLWQGAWHGLLIEHRRRDPYVPSFVYINCLISIIYNSLFFVIYPFFHLSIPSDTRRCRTIKNPISLCLPFSSSKWDFIKPSSFFNSQNPQPPRLAASTLNCLQILMAWILCFCRVQVNIYPLITLSLWHGYILQIMISRSTPLIFFLMTSWMKISFIVSSSYPFLVLFYPLGWYFISFQSFNHKEFLFFWYF